MRQKLLAHATSCISDFKPYHDMFIIISGMCSHGKNDRAAVRCKLHRITEDIDKHFTDADGISQNKTVSGRLWTLHTKLQMPVCQKTLRNVQYSLGQCAKIRRHRRIGRFSTLNPADIQHIIDQRQQMFRTGCNFFQTHTHIFVRILLHRNGGKTNDRIHRCPDIMGHTVKEFTLRFCRCLRIVYRCFQLLIFLFQLLSSPPHIYRTHNQKARQHEADRNAYGNTYYFSMHLPESGDFVNDLRVLRHQ